MDNYVRDERMTKLPTKKQPHPISAFEDLQSNGAGYDILRYVSLPQLLGKESDTIMYFLGKSLSQTVEIHSIDDIILFFKQLGWGALDPVKEKRKSSTFHLLDDSIVQKLQSSLEIDFRYESGFLAGACEQLYGTECECIEKIHHKIYQVEFTIIFT